MMRSFLTRFVDSAAWTVLLVPCLLVYLACSTPLPTEHLEKGMTQDEVRALVGGPHFTWIPTLAAQPTPGEEAWGYNHSRRGATSALYFKDGRLNRWKLLEGSSSAPDEFDYQLWEFMKPQQRSALER